MINESRDINRTGLSMEDRIEVLLESNISKRTNPTRDLLILLEVHGAIQVIRIGKNGQVIYARTSSTEEELSSNVWYACPREAIVEALDGKAATKEGLRQVLSWMSTSAWRSHPGREYESFMELGYYKPDPRAVHYLPRLSEAAKTPIVM